MREKASGHAQWRRSGRKAGAEKGYQERGEAQNASDPNAHTRWRRHAARSLVALSRTAHLRHRYEEVDGGGCRAGEAGRNGMGGRRKRMGARCGGHMRRDCTARDMELCASKKVGSPMNELCCFQRPIRIFNKKIARSAISSQDNSSELFIY